MEQKILGQLLRLAEKSFIVIGLTFFSGALGVDSLGLVVPNAVVSLFRYLTWAGSAFLILILWQNTLIAIGRNFLLFLLTVLAYFSFAWSQAPDFTLFTSRDILMMTFFGLYLAARFSLKEIVELVAFTLFIGGILSTIYAIGMPRVGVHIGDGHTGAWKGIYGHKNHFGGTMILMWLTFFSLPKNNFKIYKYFGIMLSIMLILLSTSKTSLVISLLLISIMLFYKNFRWKGKISVILLDIGIIIIGCLTVVIFTYWVELLTGIGRDSTLTGRTPVWGVMIARLIQRPFLGYGRGGFFAPKSPYAMEAGQAIRTGWIPPHGHNGFLDLAVDIGLIGLALFIIIYLTTFARVLKLAYATNNAEDFFPLAFLILLTMNNITESLLLYQTNIYWVLFITLTVMLNQKQSIPEENEESYVSKQRHSNINEISLATRYQNHG
jgi:O-antigen ligase